MAKKIGVLLPRSTDYPSIGFDILAGLEIGLENKGITGTEFITDNTGFGEDASLNYSKAEKFFLQDKIDLLVGYFNSKIAAGLYPLASLTGKPLFFADAGMQIPQSLPPENCYHISLQGGHCCYFSGIEAGKGGRKVLMATSFYEGGYYGPWCYHQGITSSGGSIAGNYVSNYKLADFTVKPFLDLLDTSGAESIAACFSSYLSELFFKGLKENAPASVRLPFYCSPFMAEELALKRSVYPGGNFKAVIPWASTIENDAQSIFLSKLKLKNKEANIFHLLGLEAGLCAAEYLTNGSSLPGDFNYESPRGNVYMHPVTRHTYGPLYHAEITGDENGNCIIKPHESIKITAEDHLSFMQNTPPDMVSGWKNNYLCI